MAHTKINASKTRSKWGSKMRENRRTATGSKTAMVKGSGKKRSKRHRTHKR